MREWKKRAEENFINKRAIEILHYERCCPMGTDSVRVRGVLGDETNLHFSSALRKCVG